MKKISEEKLQNYYYGDQQLAEREEKARSIRLWIKRVVVFLCIASLCLVCTGI